jgi:hypothetical protein
MRFDAHSVIDTVPHSACDYRLFRRTNLFKIAHAAANEIRRDPAMSVLTRHLQKSGLSIGGHRVVSG